jgi:hypothetical protein
MYEQRKERVLHKTKQIEKVRADKKKNKLKRVEVDDEKLMAGRINSKEQMAQRLLKNDSEVRFSNPLMGDDESDIYLSDEEVDRNEGIEIDPNERVPGEVDNDDAYVIRKPLTEMEKRRKMLGRKKKRE